MITESTRSLKKYFDRFQGHSSVSLIGPLCVKPGKYSEPVIFVDGGTVNRHNNEGITVGDGDSYQGKLEVELSPDKDFSDLAFVLAGIPGNFNLVELTGFLGGRRDHELFNIGEAHHFLFSRPLPTTLRFEDRITGFSKGVWEFERNGLFSIAALEQTQITISGDCRYTCAQKTTLSPMSSLGLSNQGHGTIYITCEAPVFILFDELR
jgi:thiamine pyrophosphokinase